MTDLTPKDFLQMFEDIADTASRSQTLDFYRRNNAILNVNMEIEMKRTSKESEYYKICYEHYQEIVAEFTAQTRLATKPDTAKKTCSACFIQSKNAEATNEKAKGINKYAKTLYTYEFCENC